MGPARPLPSPLSLSRARAGGVSRPAGPVGRDGRLAPHRDGAPALARAPSRVHRALQRAKNGQRPSEGRLRVASDAPIENRAGAAFAHGDARAARHVRDDRLGRYAGNPFEPRARSNRANPPWTRHVRRSRAPHRTHIRPRTVCLCEKSRSAVSDIPRVFHVDFGVSRNARLRRAAENARGGIGKIAFPFSRKKRNLPSSGFGFSARNDGRAFEFSVLFPRQTNPRAIFFLAKKLLR